MDAVLGEQTRSHDDLDIIVVASDLATLRQALESRGYQEQPEGRDSNFVLANSSGLKVDVHVIRINDEGDGLYQMEDGSIWVFSAQSLSGRGRVLDHEVRCLTAEEQVRCHNEGYEPRERDLADMALLEARLGVKLPARLQRPKT
ncbi:hypothetical protein H8E52_06525 [bacterium]|nr:hypothetical protein [bacterium]